MKHNLAIAPLPAPARHSAAREVQENIRGLERSIDTALADGAGLLARMITVGQATSLTAAQGQAAIQRVVASINAGSTMRAEIVAAHDELRTITGQINVREFGWGDLVPSPAISSATNEASA